MNIVRSFFLIALILLAKSTNAMKTNRKKKDQNRGHRARTGAVVGTGRNLRGREMMRSLQDQIPAKQLHQWPHPVEKFKMDDRPRLRRRT